MAREPQLGVMLLDGASGSGCRGNAQGDAGNEQGRGPQLLWMGRGQHSGLDVAGECGWSGEAAVPVVSTCA